MESDIEIARSATLRPIVAFARERLGIPEEALEPYGRFKAKIALDWLAGLDRPNGKLILVSGDQPDAGRRRARRRRRSASSTG